MRKPKYMNNGVSVLKFEKHIENTPLSRNSNRGWVNWGTKNQYPFDLLNLYSTSVTHRACIDFAVSSIIGRGIDYEASKMNGDDLISPNYTEDWNTILRKLATDFVLYGMFAFQIIRNKDGKTYSIWHQPMETVRLSPYDEDGQISTAWICEDWSSVGKHTPIELPMFGFQEDETIESSKPYIYVYRQYTPQNVYYSAPMYSSGLKAVQSEVEYLNYELKSISNSFVPTGLLELPPMENEKDKQEIIDEIQKMFVGSDSANSLMIAFGNGTGEQNFHFTPFQASSTNVNLYEAANERTINRIMTAHRISSKALIGLPMDSTGFSNEGTLLESAYQLYNATVGDTNRQIIINTLNSIFKMNGVDIQIVLKPLSFILQTTVASTEKKITDTVDDSTLEEKITTTDKN